ncbi:MAG TPA: amidohydrolase family protein [Terriglobia bacterium]|nr:amidohydrolase family protein [Terriglobia bacterium]
MGRVGAAFLAAGSQSPAATPASSGQETQPEKMHLELDDFQPKSMLHVAENKVPRSRFPVIDIHTHISWKATNKNGVGMGEKMTFLMEPADLLAVMDRKNLRTMVDLTGGVGSGLEETIAKYQTAHPGRFLIFTEPWWEKLKEPDYSKFQADQIEKAHRAGARGLKILKTLGLYLREDITSGPLVKIDDHRFDPMWEACAAFNLPVAIHIADPEAFFLPIDRFNERFEELNNHPDWSFHGKDFPSFAELIAARNRLYARHPKTQFISLHVGHDAENLGAVSQWMDRFPNMSVELAARIGELGRQPRASRKFFDKYQDRIMFGTDAVPHGVETPQQIFGDELYEIYYRFLESEDEYFEYAPAPTPPQGRWQIYGLGLPEGILRKIYNGNAARLLGLKV